MTTLNVLMNGRLVGYLRKLSSGAMNFQYDEAWLETSGVRPISLSLPLKYEAYEGDQVYNFFDNLLPDNEKIRARIQARFQTPTNQSFDLFTAIGSGCVGAIQLCREEGLPRPVDVTTAQAVSSEAIAKRLRAYRTVPLGMAEETGAFRTPIPGTQEKTAKA